MIPSEKMVQLAKGLLEKTRKHEASWRPDALYDFSYVLQLPGSHIRIALQQNPEVPNKAVTFTVSDANDVAVGTLEGRNDQPVGQVLHELFDQASKVATKWDKVLEEVQTALNSKGPIG